MTDAPETDTPLERPSHDVPKPRRCLRCETPFVSEWSGNRVCSRCRSSGTWKIGVPHIGRPNLRSNKHGA